MPLRIAAKVPRGARGYFKERLEPLIDGHYIQLVGELNDETKQEFLAGAAALLFPIAWPGPFGLVMIEAMACGTPVIAFRCESVAPDLSWTMKRTPQRQSGASAASITARSVPVSSSGSWPGGWPKRTFPTTRW
jgi:hypothetical protein